MTEQPAPSSRLETLVPVALVALGCGVMIARSWPGPLSDWLEDQISFHKLKEHSQQHVDDLLLVPLAAVLVVLCRVGLGLRMLGPFRPVLIGLAFYQTGVLAGTAFLVAVMLLVVVLRPRLGRGMLPYFGRLSLLLCAVVVLELVALMLGAALRLETLLDAAVFPIVVLCLSADGFARVVTEEGPAAAAMRGVVTVCLAAVISALGYIEPLAQFLFDYPEFVLVEIALVIWISAKCRWGLLERWNFRSRPPDPGTPVAPPEA
jgi:hypothetical protein